MWEQITSAVNITLIEPCLFEALALVFILNPVRRAGARNVALYIVKSLVVFVVYVVLLVSLALIAVQYQGMWFIYVSALVVYLLATLLLGFRGGDTGPGGADENMRGGARNSCDGHRVRGREHNSERHLLHAGENG